MRRQLQTNNNGYWNANKRWFRFKQRDFINLEKLKRIYEG